MNKIELETIALACLERLDAEAKEARRMQDEKIRNIEARVEDYERQLTVRICAEFAAACRRLEQYVVERRKTLERERERPPRGMSR